MQDGNYDWMNKLESKIDTVSTAVTEIGTKLDIYLNRQDDHEVRLTALESNQDQQQGISNERNRKVNQMTLGVLAVTAVTVGVGVWLSYIFNHC
jgi:hypothetical protein